MVWKLSAYSKFNRKNKIGLMSLNLKKVVDISSYKSNYNTEEIQRKFYEMSLEREIIKERFEDTEIKREKERGR